MSVIVTGHRVPLAKLAQFHEILCATGGRYRGNPQHVGEEVVVNYEAGDYNAQCLAWHRCVTPVIEKRRDQPWRRLLRRLGMMRS